MTVRSAWHYNSPAQNPGQTRQDTRLVPIGTMTPVDAMTTRSGVIPGGTGLLLTGTVMTGTIATGRATVQGTSGQGAYPVAVTAAETFTVANGHASLPRIDSVFLVAYDQLYDTSGQTLAAVVYTQGTAAASPSAPTAPATGTAYLKLWDIAVPALASSGSPINWATALTDRRTYTAAVGGITPDGATAGAYSGQYRDGGTTTGLERYNGSAWESRVYLGTSGQIVIGTDTNLFRGGPNTLRTNDSLVVDGALTVSGVGGIQTAIKSADTSVTSNTTLGVDPHLSLPVVANATYHLEAWFVYTGDLPGAAADLKADWTIPSAATMRWARWGYPANAVNQIDSVETDNTTIRALGTYGGSTNISAKPVGRIVTGANAGTLQLRWAQNGSSSLPTIMRAGSWIRLLRVL